MSKVTSENWEQVKELFEAALKREAVERVAFLDGACAGDEALRREVESLHKSYEQAGSFMDAPAVEAAAESLLGEQVKLSPGQRMGHYQLSRNERLQSRPGRKGPVSSIHGGRHLAENGFRLLECWMVGDLLLERQIQAAILQIEFSESVIHTRFSQKRPQRPRRSS